MNRNKTVVKGSWRGAAAICASLLFVVAPGIVACGGQALEQSTETGNPPLVAADRIQVMESSNGAIEVRGSAGAIEPGGAPVLVTNTTTGEDASTNSKPNGAFSVTLAGSSGDDFRVEVTSEGDSAKATLPGPAGASSASDVSVCEKICAGPRECGARETLFPVSGCDCDASVCDCTEAECVDACEADTRMYQARSISCAVSLADAHACIMEASCEQFRDADADALMAIPACERAMEFEQVCGFGSGECDASGASGKTRAGSDEYLDCEVVAGCGGTNYGLDCHQVEGGYYDCSCRIDGASRVGFSKVDGCNFVSNASEGGAVNHMAFVCGFELPGVTDRTGECEPPDYMETQDGTPGACWVGTSCANGDFELDCRGSGEGILCSCLRDGEKVSETLIDGEGCAGSSFPRGDQGRILMMNSLCEF